MELAGEQTLPHKVEVNLFLAFGCVESNGEEATVPFPGVLHSTPTVLSLQEVAIST